ncbi:MULTISPECIES: hypothetical protein [unclassified Thioalkalivibrio]|uniref:hypothetical protein n=1 Tax=unclassified Thioalkalivibrio TaxID=2621013 RepID=UPI00037FD21F|nr:MULTISPECIES: hypothetical protein [unclassified Thioalkalivibrio]
MSEHDNPKPQNLKTSERLVWLGFMLFFVVVLAIYIARGNGLEQDLAEANRDLLQTQMQLQQYTRHEVPRPVELGLTNAHIQDLQRRGMARPNERLANDLMQQTGLIPHEAPEGEAYAFRRDGIHVLNHQWVLANFEGDSAHGQLLLAYEVVHGNVHWEVLESTLDRM